jgi:hypothetical protein
MRVKRLDPDPDLHQSKKSGEGPWVLIIEAWRLKMKLWKVYRV